MDQGGRSTASTTKPAVGQTFEMCCGDRYYGRAGRETDTRKPDGSSTHEPSGCSISNMSLRMIDCRPPHQGTQEIFLYAVLGIQRQASLRGNTNLTFTGSTLCFPVMYWQYPCQNEEICHRLLINDLRKDNRQTKRTQKQ